MTIVITGGSGMIGTAISKALLAKGHTVISIDTRGPTFTHKSLFFIPCDLERETLPFNVLERTDAIIHLAGKRIIGKWTSSMKRSIKDSRVISTKHVIQSLEQTTNKPPIFISASGVGYYGEGFERDLDERSAKGTTFLADTVAEWEKEVQAAEAFGCRVVIVRTAPVLARGGFLREQLRGTFLHLLFTITKKDFWMPWIHIDDVVRIYLFALETGTLQGVVNAVAPTPTRYRDFIRMLARETKSLVVGRAPLLKVRYGELIEEMTRNQKVYPQRLIDKGFAFAYTNLSEALHDIVHAKK